MKKLKKAFFKTFVLVGLIAAISNSVLAYAEDGTVIFKVSDSEGTVGEDMRISITNDTGVDFSNGKFYLHYNNEVLNYKGFELLPSSAIAMDDVSVFNDEHGISYIVISIENVQNANVVFDFTIVAEGNPGVSLDVNELFDQNNEPVRFTVENGTVIVNPIVTEPETTTTTTETTTTTTTTTETTTTTTTTTETITTTTTTTTETTTTTVNTEKPSDNTTTTINTEKPSDNTTTTVSTEKPSDSTATTVNTEKPSDSTATTVNTEKPSDNTTTTVSTEKPSDNTTTTVSTEKPSDNTTTTANTEKPFNSTTSVKSDNNSNNTPTTTTAKNSTSTGNNTTTKPVTTSSQDSNENPGTGDSFPALPLAVALGVSASIAVVTKKHNK